MEIRESLAQIKHNLGGLVDAERVIKAFIRYSPSPLVMLDSSQKILIWTQAFCDEFGIDPSKDLSGVSLFSVIPCCYENNSDFHKAIIEEASFTGKLVCASSCQIPLRCTNVVREYTINPWPKNGHMGGVIIYFKNITKEKEFEAVLDSIPGYIFYKDRENRNVWVNKELAEDLGLDRNAIIGKSWNELDPKNSDKYYKDDKKVFDSGTKVDFGLEWIMLPTGPVQIHTTKLPWFDNFGNIKGIIGYSNKVKERVSLSS